MAGPEDRTLENRWQNENDNLSQQDILRKTTPHKLSQLP
jgi:hypothetical protein